jgi:alanyl-tRNA synthetase
MDVDKNELRKEFARDWEKHYKLETLLKKGFRRATCKKCGRNFWSIEDREYCGDASCIGYQFIGNTPVKKKLSYIDTWKVVENYFTSHGHTYVKPYPTVARWRDDLYFTVASINDFQPYVVNGEVEPPANPLIIPQPCIRFVDIANVGVSGRHYTNFVMIGQHAFNTEKTGLFYWKEEAIEHDIAYLKQLGIPENELIFIEDVWAGGGNFGPSIEYFVRGLELGNCVFMQYEITETGPRELKTKVIDMGAGLSRLAWITNGDPTSYEVVFGEVIDEMKKDCGVKIDRELFLKFAKISGSLNEDEIGDIEKEKSRVAALLGVSKEELFSQLEPLQALYATCDHLCTLLFTVTDGMLPSNAGGGYNLRMILRRVFGFEEEFGFEFDYEKIINGHAKHLEYLFPHLKRGVETTLAVIDEEKKKYKATKEKAKGKIESIVKKAKGKRITKEDLFMLYKSHGIPPEYIIEVAKENNIEVEMPGNFYKLVKESELKKAEEKPSIDVTSLEKTKVLYYSDIEKFEANVCAVLNSKYVVLDQTAFYPEGGGQVADTGIINGRKVKNVIKIAGVILHEVENAADFKKGDRVTCSVDMKRRKAITKHHTATHLLNAACRELLGQHVWQAGAYKDEEKAHLDITHYKRITQDELNKIELKVNEFIAANLPITIEVLPRDVAENKYGFILYQGGAVPGKELRVVSIGNIDSEACGGTHHMLKTTGEIGCFKIVKRESVQDGVERIIYKCGEAAIKYIQEKEAILREAAEKISVSEHELPRSVERFFNEWKEQRKKIERLSEELIKEEVKDIIAEGKEKVVIRILDLDDMSLKKIASAVASTETNAAVLLNKEGMLFCAAGKNSRYKANELMKKVIEQLGGAGGGSETIASGKVKKVEIPKF